MSRLAARLLYLCALLVGRLPWPWLWWLGDRIAARNLAANRRESRVTDCNLRLAFPGMGPGERAELKRAVMHTTARQAMETVAIWSRTRRGNLDSLIVEMHGTRYLDEAIAAGRGVVLAAPHFGNWELLNRWLAARTPLSILYAPPSSRVMEGFLQLVRADENRVTQVRAETAGVRQLLRYLRDGGVVGILPDQQPRGGEGEFAPFFGVPALTMTLFGKLAARTGAAVLLAWCERLPGHGPGGRPRFALHLEPADPAVADPDPARAVAALNAEVERIARRDPVQYQWTYKRYSLQPSGRGEDNPYWPECYR